MSTLAKNNRNAARAYVPTSALAKTVEFDHEMMRVHLTDGVVILEIMPWVIGDYAEAGIVERPALDHVGFSVESLAAYRADLDAFVAEYPEAGPWVDKRTEERLNWERGARNDLLSTCAYYETHLWDPECVLFDVHERRG